MGDPPAVKDRKVLYDLKGFTRTHDNLRAGEKRWMEKQEPVTNVSTLTPQALIRLLRLHAGRLEPSCLPPVLKNTDWYQTFSIILKKVTLDLGGLKIQHRDQNNIGHDIGQYRLQILWTMILILVNTDRGDPVEFLWRSCGVPVEIL